MKPFSQVRFRSEQGQSSKIKKFRYYSIRRYDKLDNWLSEMSRKGWHIEHCGWFIFQFERGQPEDRIYFTYADFSQEVKYSLTLRHPFFEKRYGLNSSKSIINSDKTKKYQILEVDPQKVNLPNDSGFVELINDRNRLYSRYVWRNVLVFILAVIFIFVCNISMKQ